MAYRLLHKKSSVKNRVPNVDVLDYGELAINYNAESPTLYIKDNNNEIKDFISKDKINDLLNKKQNIAPKLTHAVLLHLISTNSLISGQKYHIYDYVTTTTQSGTSAATHPFDIIVEATSTNTLSEDAQATQSNRDNGYFDGNKLESWEIKYCIYNDTSRFAWADAEKGKGVIYYMKDEFKNEAWYDFKNILFLRTASWFQSNPQFHISFDKDTYFYTFSRVESDYSIKDDTLYTSNYHAINNSLGKNDAKITKLNNTIFIDKPNKGAFNNVIADGHKDNTFGYSIWNNNIGYQFSGNTIYENCQYNNIQTKCCDNKISKYFTRNNVQNYFSHNTILGSFTNNNVENDCFSNEFISDVLSCNFKQKYQYNHCDEYKYITIDNTKIQVIDNKITYNGSNYNVVNNHVIVINGIEYEVISKTLSYCTFGDNNNWISDMIPMTNVTIGNSCFTGTSDNKVFLNNSYTKENKKLLDAIKEFNDAYEYTIMSCSNNTYDIFSHDVVNKVSNIYDMGAFNSSSDAENKAKEGGIATNKNINYLKYITADNKTGLIEQLVGETETIQILSWNGVRYYRILQFSYFNGYPTSINNPSWEKLKLVSEKEWDSFSGTVKTSGDQVINGYKTFNSDIKLSYNNTIKTIITNVIDPGEFKLLHKFKNKDNTSQGFIIRTINPNQDGTAPNVYDILPLEILTTNGQTKSLIYKFPTTTGGNVAIGAKIGETTINASLTNGLIDLTNALSEIVTTQMSSIEENVQENAEVTAAALVNLNSKITDLANQIAQLSNRIQILENK
mgnify:CR=1 FL=1